MTRALFFLYRHHYHSLGDKSDGSDVLTNIIGVYVYKGLSKVLLPLAKGERARKVAPYLISNRGTRASTAARNPSKLDAHG
jgi:hypothetical protein